MVKSDTWLILEILLYYVMIFVWIWKDFISWPRNEDWLRVFWKSISRLGTV